MKKIWLSALDKRDFKNVYVKNEHIKEKTYVNCGDGMKLRNNDDAMRAIHVIANKD